MKILIAEDMCVPKVLLKTFLLNMGHEVTATGNGVEAWQAFQEEPYPLVITDWLMPFMDGLELCRRIRSVPQPEYTYVIMLTMLDGKTKCLEALEAGVDDFMVKPLDSDQLAARLLVAERFRRVQSRVSQLELALGVCPTCRKIRDGQGRMVTVAQYTVLHRKTAASAGLCSSCNPVRASA